MKAMLLALVVCCFWPSWLWFVQRSLSDGDQLAVLALITAVFMLLQKGPEQNHENDETAGDRTSLKPPILSLFARDTSESLRLPIFSCFAGGTRDSLKLPILLLIVSGTSEFFLPRSVQIALALCTVFCFAQALYGRRAPQSLGMLFLAAPAVSTLEFFLGYPLRSLAAALSATLLNLAGLGAWAQGVQLFCRGHEIVIDSACSGLHMLWISFYLSLLLSWRRSLSLLATAQVLCAALVTTIAANVIRATAITMYEQSALFSLRWQELSHQIIGLGCFVIVSAGILWLVEKLSGKQANTLANKTREPEQSQISARAKTPAMATVLIAGLISIVPLTQTTAVANISSPDYKDTLSEFGFTNYRAKPLNSDEAKFAAAYPGSIAKFECGDKAVLLRSINCESRQVHSSADCYRGQGYGIKTLPIIIENDKRWSRFSAIKNSTELLVQECIVGPDGKCWTDPSSWYWAAVLGKASGPWVFITVASPVQRVQPARPVLPTAEAHLDRQARVQ